MAGYMRKLGSYVYNGEYKAAQAMANGTFVDIQPQGVKPIAADGDAVLRVAEKTTLFGKKALVLDVVTAGTKETYFLENEAELPDGASFDTAEHICKAGDYCRMHRLIPGEQLIMSVADEVYTAHELNALVKPATGGSVKANA